MLAIEEVGILSGRIIAEVEKAVIGKRDAIELGLLAILADGHVLIEDFPGLATIHPSSARLTTAAGACLTAVVLAIYPVVLGPAGVGLLVIGVAAACILVLSLSLHWSGGIPWALAGLGIEYAISLHLRGGAAVDASTALYSAALLLVAELAYWSLTSPPRARLGGEVVARRVLLTVVLLGGSVVLGLLLVLITQVSVAGSLIRTVLGVTAAILVLAVLAALERRYTA